MSPVGEVESLLRKVSVGVGVPALAGPGADWLKPGLQPRPGKNSHFCFRFAFRISARSRADGLAGAIGTDRTLPDFGALSWLAA